MEGGVTENVKLYIMVPNYVFYVHAYFILKRRGRAKCRSVCLRWMCGGFRGGRKFEGREKRKPVCCMLNLILEAHLCFPMGPRRLKQ